MMIERPTVTVSTSAGDITLSAHFNGDAVPLVCARFERLAVSRVPYKGVVQARQGAAEVFFDSVHRADKLLQDPTWEQRKRVRALVLDVIRAEAWRVLEGSAARDARRAELQVEVDRTSSEVARLRAELAAWEAADAKARAELAALG